MTVETDNVFDLIEREIDHRGFFGKVVGFPYIEFSGHSLAEVEAKLREAALDYAASEVLVLETKFVALVRLDATATGTESAPLALSREPVQRDTPPRAASAETGNMATDLDDARCWRWCKSASIRWGGRGFLRVPGLSHLR